MTLTPGLSLLIYCGVALGAAGASIVASVVGQRRQRAAIQAYTMEMASLHGSVQQHVVAYGRLTAILQQLVAAAEGLDSRLERLELRGTEPSYGRAIAVVQRGGDADTLVRDFGLSQAEAELVSVVHARRVAS